MLCNKNENTNIPSFGNIGIGVEIIFKKWIIFLLFAGFGLID